MKWWKQSKDSAPRGANKREGEMDREKVQKAIDKVCDLSGDIEDVLGCCGGPRPPWDDMTYRGSLLNDLLENALVLQAACSEKLK